MYNVILLLLKQLNRIHPHKCTQIPHTHTHTHTHTHSVKKAVSEEYLVKCQQWYSLEGGMSGRNFNFLYSFKNYRRVTVKRKNILSQFRVMVNFLLHSSTEGKKKLPVALKAEMS